MPSSFRFAVTFLAVGLAPAGAAGRCQTGVASAPYIGAADLRSIDKAAAGLPQVRRGRVQASIGAPVPASVKRAPVPKAIIKVLPQYKGYAAFRIGGRRFAVANRRGVLSYLMPLGTGAKPGNCP